MAIPKGYRLLDEGEKIKKGDLFSTEVDLHDLSANLAEWHPRTLFDKVLQSGCHPTISPLLESIR